jgi:hypothetical protein
VSMYTNSFDSDYGDGPGAAVWIDTLGDLIFLFYILYFIFFYCHFLVALYLLLSCILITEVFARRF